MGSHGEDPHLSKIKILSTMKHVKGSLNLSGLGGPASPGERVSGKTETRERQDRGAFSFLSFR